MDNDQERGVQCELEAVAWRLKVLLFIGRLVDLVNRLQHIPTSIMKVVKYVG